MRAITLIPGRAGSATLEDFQEPPASDGAILARAPALGVCGTDHEIVAGAHGEAPDGSERLVLEHESLGDVVGRLNGKLVLNNEVVFGSVNANRAHYDLAAHSLKYADPKWLSRLISRRVPLAHWREALKRRPGDIKVIIDFTL